MTCTVGPTQRRASRDPACDLQSRASDDGTAVNGTWSASAIAPASTPSWVLAECAPEVAPHWIERRRLLYSLTKRAFDIVCASIALILLSPLLLAIVGALLLERTWPVFYAGTRIGHYGRPFRMLKFRTMRPDWRQQMIPVSFPDRRLVLKDEHDPRITRVGHLLRRASLDELPQLINVLRGEMSLVGPRPEVPEMVELYEGRHYLRHLAMPGLTGWWQVNGRCGRSSEVDAYLDLEQKLADDIYYLEHRSFGFDLLILMLTVSTVLSRRGAI